METRLERAESKFPHPFLNPTPYTPNPGPFLSESGQQVNFITPFYAPALRNVLSNVGFHSAAEKDYQPGGGGNEEEERLRVLGEVITQRYHKNGPPEHNCRKTDLSKSPYQLDKRREAKRIDAREIQRTSVALSYGKMAGSAGDQLSLRG